MVAIKEPPVPMLRRCNQGGNAMVVYGADGMGLSNSVVDQNA
ncbi:hypothetical protein [Paenibacillus sp. SZ31]|nr:hypothetical protein [Paenibacillus sp. SZ31]